MNSQSSTLRRIARVLNDELGANVNESDLQVTRLDQVIAFDSVALLQLAIGLEREFGIHFEPDCMTRDFLVETARLVEYFDRELGAQRK